MCGGAILANIIPATPPRRATAAHVWPGGDGEKRRKVGGGGCDDDFEAAFERFGREDSEMEEEEVEEVVVGKKAAQALLDAAGGAKKRPRSEPHVTSDDEVLPASFDSDNNTAAAGLLPLDDPFLFGDLNGGAFASLMDGLFAAGEANVAGESVGLWSFGDDCLNASYY
uniref:Uncharacterized protein n=1 Tax=Oryza barthii TaxID=65489 RepID=A0A0D3FEN9_9ORYZ